MLYNRSLELVFLSDRNFMSFDQHLPIPKELSTGNAQQIHQINTFHIKERLMKEVRKEK
jgi:hypothetical protein